MTVYYCTIPVTYEINQTTLSIRAMIDTESTNLKIKRKEDNDQESIQLPNTFLPRHERERRHHNQNNTGRKPKDRLFSQKNCQTAIQNKYFTRTYMQRHSMTEIVNHNRSTALERSVKILRGEMGWAGGLYRFYVATTVALSSAVVYTRYLFKKDCLWKQRTHKITKIGDSV